jgi:hypothetical protein
MSALKFKTALATAALTLLATTGAQAVPTTDVQDYSNNTATEYFVDVDANKTTLPYYRRQNDDWGWVHGAIAGSGFTSVVLDVSAYDVDFAAGEVDKIEVYDGTGWVFVGNLAGSNNTWDFSTFNLSAYSWAEAQVNAGLRVRMDIDTNRAGWAVTLGKATLAIDGGSTTCVPTPGIPCTNTVAEPGTLALFGLALGGLAWTSRRKAKALRA